MNEFAKFLELPESERLEYLTGVKLTLWQCLWIKYINKWWTRMKDANPHLQAHILWESIYKGRF